MFVRHEQGTEERQVVTPQDVDFAADCISNKVAENMAKHGCGTFINTAEMMGVLAEEMHEVVDVVFGQERDMTLAKHEIMDLAAAALFAWLTIHKWEQPR